MKQAEDVNITEKMKVQFVHNPVTINIYLLECAIIIFINTDF